MARSSMIAALVIVSAPCTRLRPISSSCYGRKSAVRELQLREVQQEGPGR